MKREEYVETIVCKGRMVNVGIDDAGQQYFFEYLNHKGELQEVGCGAYNADYLGTIADYFDPVREMDLPSNK